MSQEAMAKFIKAVNESPDLQASCKGALDGAADPSAFVALAKENGYEFTKDDARSFFDDVLGAQQPNELTNSELDQVAGGAGSKDMPRPDSRLGETVRLFRGLNLKTTPSWTSFR